MPADDTRTLFVRMPAELHDAIKRAAEAEDRTVAQFIRHAMRRQVGVDVREPVVRPAR